MEAPRFGLGDRRPDEASGRADPADAPGAGVRVRRGGTRRRLLVVLLAVVPVVVSVVVSGITTWLPPSWEAWTRGLRTLPSTATGPERASGRGAVRDTGAIPAPGTGAGSAGEASRLPDARVSAVAVLLRARNLAVPRRDLGLWLRTLAPGAEDFRSRQRELFAALTSLPVTSWTCRATGSGPPLATAERRRFGAQAWAATVLCHYRLSGYDHADVPREQVLVLVPTRLGWRLAGSVPARDRTGGLTVRDLWDVTPVTLVAGASVLVVAAKSERDPRSFAESAARSIARVDRTWTAPWPRKLVVLVPASPGQMAAVLGCREADVQQLAAVTTSQVRENGAGTGARIVLNPSTYPSLSRRSQDVVMTHEVTHVATGALPGRRPPLWLSEGFADFVAYQGSGIPVQSAARSLLRRVQKGFRPLAMPSDSDFVPTSDDLAGSYEQAWLALQCLAEMRGQQAPTRLYRSMTGLDPPSDQRWRLALGVVAGLTPAQFVNHWQRYLVRLAQGSGSERS